MESLVVVGAFIVTENVMEAVMANVMLTSAFIFKV